MSPLALSGFDIVEFIKNLNEEVEWMAEGLIPDPSITMIYATDGIGKSLIGVQMAIELCSGFQVFKTLHTTRPYKVIYVMAERSIKEPMKRIKKMLADPDYDGKIAFENLAVTTEFQGKDLSNTVNADALIGVLKRHSKDIGGCDLIVFDPLYALVKGDLKDDQPINAVFNFFRRAITELTSNIIFFHHENRGSKEVGSNKRTGQDFYGNKFISGLCTAVFHMVQDDSDRCKTFLITEKDTESALIPKLALIYDPEFNTVQGDVNSSPKTKKLLIDAFLKKKKESLTPFTQKTFFLETKIVVHPVSERRMIAGLVKSGEIKHAGKDGDFNMYVAV